MIVGLFCIADSDYCGIFIVKQKFYFTQRGYWVRGKLCKLQYRLFLFLICIQEDIVLCLFIRNILREFKKLLYEDCWTLKGSSSSTWNEAHMGFCNEVPIDDGQSHNVKFENCDGRFGIILALFSFNVQCMFSIQKKNEECKK